MRTRLAAVAALAAGAFLLAGCGGSDTASTTEFAAPGDAGGGVSAQIAPDSMGMPEAEARADGSVSSDTTTPMTATNREVVRTGSMSMEAGDVAKAVAQIRALTAAAQGFVSAENTTASDDVAYSSITVQVPAAKLDGFVDKVSALGTVTSLDLTSQDVTSQAVDLDARIKALQTSVDRMTDLLAQASDVSDLMAIESQLSSRQAELDALKAQRTWLSQQVAMSTLSVSVSPVRTVEAVESPGFSNGLENGWAALVSTVGVAVTALGFFLPFLILLAIVGVPVTIWCVWMVRRHKRRTIARAAALRASAPTPVDAEAGPPQP
jgi:hypothetical protein